MQSARTAAAALLLAAALGGRAVAQPASLPTRSDLETAVALGRLATLAPLCGLRRQGWGEDLRRAAVQDATRAPSPDDPALRAAPGSDRASGALGYADAEALEDFAAAPPAATCGPLAHDPAMAEADSRVTAYRADLARSLRQY